jgi:tRNA nucleotidyltransferase (CCA-adding enzyme)
MLGGDAINMKINIPEEVKFILNTLSKNGYEAYIVGGCVRDSILNKEPKDWDITTEAKPEVVKQLFDKVVLTGIKHGTVTVVINNEGYEVTTYRADGEYEDNRRPKEVKFVNSLKEDLARRDFTINAMAFNESNGLVDYFNGVEDLNNKIIKTVGNPEERFNEDALRMLRAVRFSAQLDFNIEKNLLKAINKLGENVKNISKERIRDEFNKILLNDPMKIDILKDCKILELIIPNINCIYDFDQNNQYHNYDLYNHTLKAIEVIEPKLHLRLAMLLHDFGKINIKTTDEKGISHYYNHSKESVELAKYILKYLKYDNDTINKVLILIQYHDCTLKSKLSVKKLLNKIGEEAFRDLIKVQKSDVLAQNPIYAKERLLNMISIQSKLDLILEQNECFSLKDLKINGSELIDLGFNKGKEIGEILNYLLEKVIENPELNNKEKLIEFVKERGNCKFY